MQKTAPFFVAAFIVISVASLFPRIALGPGERVADESVRLLFVGDIFFDRSIRTAMRERGAHFPLSCVAERLAAYDLVIGNLEGPITSYLSVSEGSTVGSPENYTFTFAPESARALYRANIHLVNLGNNHIMNFGPEGLAQTKRFLKEARVSFFESLDEISTIYRTTLRNVPISFVNYNEFGGLSLASTSELIHKEKVEGRIVVVYAHWGEEYTKAPLRVREAARELIDAGADLIIGSHPHVVLEKEVYRGKTIYYSLGNFLFDQFWNDDVSQGLAVELSVNHKGTLAFKEFSTQMGRDRRVCFS